MSDKEKEKKVFSQELNRDDLKAAAGGGEDFIFCGNNQQGDCIKDHFRNIYGGKGFPNCASSVEDGSSCDDADACFAFSVVYDHMKGCWGADCHRAWR